jgi:hypothetical protein
MEDETPPPTPQPYGALVPPRKGPPTALATLPAPLPHGESRSLRDYSSLNPFQQFLSRAFDVVDDFADTVAEGLGLRGR